MFIEDWIDTFFRSWKDYDIDRVLSLFSDDVEYWETPYHKISGKVSLKKEWQYILSQKNIQISYRLLSESESGYTISWELSYLNLENKEKQWAGLYFLKLDTSGLCTYFLQVGEELKIESTAYTS